ncbi:MAG: STAS domain-containing protein [Mariprofundaceae bacterium]|nr:STAS domain-containing protein [Mariprofundaceae bacterium]
MKLDVTMEHQSAGVINLVVVGVVNIHTSPRLRDALKPLLTEQNKEVHIDLAGVSFMDSSGIATLVEGLQWARQSGGRFVLHKLQAVVLDVFMLAKLDTVFEIAQPLIEDKA